MKRILLIILLSSFIGQFSKASSFNSDDSCTTGVGLLIRFVDDLTTFGLFEGYSYNFHMYGAPGTTDSTGAFQAYGSGDDATYGCNANYYVDASGGSAYMHNSTYCQSDGTNCCPGALDPNTNQPYPSAIGVPGGCTGDCNPAGGLQFCYDVQDVGSGSTSCVSYWAQSGFTQEFLYPPSRIRAVSYGGNLCIQFLTNLGYQSIGCKPIPDCTQAVVVQSCDVAPSCYSYAAQNSMFMLPITGAIIQCINDTLEYLFYGNPGCVADSDSNMAYTLTMFSSFQGEMRNAVRSALMLFVILSGMKMVLSSEHTSKSEFAKMATKFILVLYFSTGININGLLDSNGQPYYDDGIHRYMYPLFTTGSSELATMVYTAGGSSGLCYYDSSKYKDGYEYLSMWDSLDCRLMYYFGVDASSFNTSEWDASTTLTPDDLGDPLALYLIVPTYLSYQLLFLIFIVVFMVLLLSILLYFLNISVLSAILVAIMIYLAPIFVPMALFNVTKGYYDAWLRLTISYALQPMIVATYIALMFSVFDQSMFGDCVFENKSINFQMNGVTKNAIPFYVLCDPNDASNASTCFQYQNYCENGNTENCYSTSANLNSEYTPKCSTTVGYYLNPVNDLSLTNSISAIFFSITQLNSSVASDLTNSLITLCLFAYLFYKFADVLSDFAAELTSGNAIGAAAGSPMAVAKKVAEMAKQAAKAAATSGASAGSSAASSSSDSSSRSNSTSSSSDSKSSSGAKSSSSDSKQ